MCPSASRSRTSRSDAKCGPALATRTSKVISCGELELDPGVIFRFARFAISRSSRSRSTCWRMRESSSSRRLASSRRSRISSSRLADSRKLRKRETPAATADSNEIASAIAAMISDRGRLPQALLLLSADPTWKTGDYGATRRVLTLNTCGAALELRRGVRSFGAASPSNEGDHMSIWLLVLIIVIVVLLLGGFGYSRR